MKNLILTLIITLPLTLLGQGWEQIFGNIDSISNHGYSVQQTNDGGYILLGKTVSIVNSESDVYLIKTDINGNELWNKTFGGVGDESGNSVHQTNDGGYIITGYTLNSFGLVGESYVYLIKTDGSGNEQWSQTFGGIIENGGISVHQTTDEGYIIGGYTYSFGNGESDVYLIKTDVSGNEQWSKTFGGVNYDFGYSVQQTSDGGYVITGNTNSYGNGNYDIYLIKTDGNGNELWSNTFGGSDSDYGYSVQQTTDGGFILCGSTTSFGNGSYDLYLIKTDGNGIEQWSETFGDIGYDEGTSVQQTSDGGYIITGWIQYQGNNETEIYLIKTDINGVEQWSKVIGDLSYEKGFDVKVTNDGGYVIIGEKAYAYLGDVWFHTLLIKTDDQGNITSTFEIPLPNPDRKLEKTIDILGKETKPQPNTPIIEIYNDGSVEKKLIVD
jgi:hypothetical protein